MCYTLFGNAVKLWRKTGKHPEFQAEALAYLGDLEVLIHHDREKAAPPQLVRKFAQL